MKCLECGDKIYGRIDKKFCSDSCRNTYNNKQNRDNTNLMRRINNTLRKNYRILTHINSDGKTKTTRTQLLNAGFDFDYITEFVVYKNGSQYRFVYDQGYKILDDDFILLVKKNE